MNDDDDDDMDVRPIEEAPQEVLDQMAKLLRAGKIEWSQDALENIKEAGISEEEIVAMLRRKVGGLDS